MTLHISREQARRLLALYHFTPTDLPGVFERLGTVQYDPLNPVGRNPDLVLQARIAGYRVDDWQKAAYTDRLIYDAYDKQACLVPVSDWPMRALIRENYRPYHDRQILQAEADAVATVLATIDARGPLSSLEFEDQSRMGEPGSWAGLTRTKRILRSLWVCGQLVTHHRNGGRHYYDRPERVIPSTYFNTAPLLDEAEYHSWIMLRRFKAAGMLRTTAEAATWSACGNSNQRALAVAQLVEEGKLTPVHVGEKAWLYYMPTSALQLLDVELPAPRMIFLGPLDNLLWDRKALMQLFNFDYTWEVYKPEALRKWGYYVLPVFYGDRFVARVDSRLEKGVWTISRWWWEPGITPDAELLDALRAAIEGFLCYLRADSVRVDEDVQGEVRQAIAGIVKKL
jgi:uncharacterized protein YcaQ